MVDNANKITATKSILGNQGITEAKALEVKDTPSVAVGSIEPVMMITKAVMVHTTTVSMKGSNKATIPSLMGSSVRAAECAIEADPTPASLEKAALWKPTIKTPTKPPAIPSGEKAPEIIDPKALGIMEKLLNVMKRAVSK